MKLLSLPAAFLLWSTFFYSCTPTSTEKSSEGESVRTAAVTQLNQDSLVNLGKQIAGKSAKALGAKLKSAMKAGGPPNAVSFCSESAIPTTDSLSSAFGVTIQRVAKRNRNPNNGLNQASLAVFDEMNSILQNGGELSPVLKEEKGATVFYAPIVLKGMCVTCHGSHNEISGSTKELIDESYPNDKAIGFLPGDLRGLWKITF